MKRLFCVLAIIILTTGLMAQNIYESTVHGNMRRGSNGKPIILMNMKNNEFSGTPQQIADAWLASYGQTVLEHPVDLDIEYYRTIQTPAGHHVEYRQIIGYQVVNSLIGVTIDNNNNITFITNFINPLNQPIPAATITMAQAQINAEKSFPNGIKSTVHPMTGKQVVFIDDSGENKYGYRFHVVPRGEYLGEWVILVNAYDGSIVYNRDMSMNYDGNGYVWDPEPGTYLNDRTISDDRDYNHPSFIPAYKDVTLTRLNPADGNGNYRLRGQYAHSYPTAEWPYDCVEQNHTDFYFNRSQLEFEEVNTYYHLDKYVNYVHQLGFSPQWNDHVNNGDYTRGDAIFFDSDVYAWEIPPHQGKYLAVAEEILLPRENDYGVQFKDTGEDQSIIIHELGHALHDYLILGDDLDYAHSLELEFWDLAEGIGGYISNSYRRQSAPGNLTNYFSNWTQCFDLEQMIVDDPNLTYNDWWDYSNPLLQSYRKKLYSTSLMRLEYCNPTDMSQGIRYPRDEVTTLLLNSIAYISFINDIYDNVIALYQADLDLYQGKHLAFLIDMFHEKELFHDQVIENNVSNNIRWENYKLIKGDINVLSGANIELNDHSVIVLDGNLIIDDGATFTVGENVTFIGLNNNAKVTVRGSVTFGENAMFTAPDGHTWDGLFVSRVADPFTLGKAEFKNCNLWVDATDCTINDCDFDNSEAKFTQCTYAINNCRLNNSDIGVWAIDCSRSSITNCDIDNMSDYGIFIQNGNVKIEYVEITNSYFGLKSSYATTSVEGSIIDASTSVEIASYQDFVDLDYNQNQIKDDTAQNPRDQLIRHYLDSVPLNSPEYRIRNNYWGQQFNASNDFQLRGPMGTILNATWSYLPIWTPSIRSGGGEEPAKILFMQAQEYRSNGDYENAEAICYQIINEYPNTEQMKYSLSLLYFMKEEYDQDYYSLAEYYTNHPYREEYPELIKHFDKYTRKCKVKMGEYENVINELENIILTSEEDEEILDAVVDLEVVYLTLFSNGSRLMSNGKIGSLLIRNADDFHRNIRRYINRSPWMKYDVSTAQSNKKHISTSVAPNPFNPTTTISFDIPENAKCELSIYNVKGQRIKTLVKEELDAGSHSIVWNGKNNGNADVSSGIYFYRIEAEGQKPVTKKMILMK